MEISDRQEGNTGLLIVFFGLVAIIVAMIAFFMMNSKRQVNTLTETEPKQLTAPSMAPELSIQDDINSIDTGGDDQDFVNVDQDLKQL